MKKMLIAYYSWSNGNTKAIVEALQKATGADIVRLDTKVPYSDDHDAVVAQGKREVEKHFRPEIKPLGVDISDYDVIAVGTPTWWYTMSPAVLILITNKTIDKKSSHNPYTQDYARFFV